MAHFSENFVSVNKLISRIRGHWKGPLALIADTCRSPAYPYLNVKPSELSEQISYTDSTLCCFSTAARAAANDGMDGMPNPFTTALLRCLFKSGPPLRSTILNACSMPGKDEQPSCAIMKFPDVPLIPAFCEIIYVGKVLSDSAPQLDRLRKAMERHENCPDAAIAVVSSGTPDVLKSINEVGVLPWEFDTSTGLSDGKRTVSELSITTYAKIVSAWEARSGLNPVVLMFLKALQCLFTC
jgi:hypothetical protein